ncbi:LysR family transcriptional regulator [Fulvimarina sp. MAC3]|uniref:LysR family transcriptional regulator n=1 Tax=Fulvimarina sp. MAC3 TaxID=3148887 RepID=UPI0031FBEBA1
MQQDDLLTLDLRAFQVLATVAQAESFTRAAEVLGISQSVVSYNVDKLRQVFDDPLFVRVGGRTRATDQCRAIIAFSDIMIADARRLRVAARFDPATATDRLVIACNYFERMLIVPRVATALTRAAPLMQIEIVDASGTGHEKLMNREADLLIGPFQREDAAFYARTLVTESYACLLDPAHPMADRPLSLDRYLEMEHILVTYGGRWRSSYLTELDRKGLSLRAAIQIPSPAGIEELVRGSHRVATLPTALARRIGGGLRIHPFPLAAELPVKLIWTVEQHHSAKSIWVRDVIARTIGAGLDAVGAVENISA